MTGSVLVTAIAAASAPAFAPVSAPASAPMSAPVFAPTDGSTVATAATTVSPATQSAPHERGRGTARAPLLEQIQACAPLVAPDTAMALVHTESAGNPYAIGVVGNALTRQPRNAPEALATAAELERQGWDYSVGLAQINRRNFARLRLTLASAMEPCTNLRAMQTLLVDCFGRADLTASATERGGPDHRHSAETAHREQHRLRRALSCYYSGNFKTGFTRDLPGQPAYVDRVLNAWRINRTRGSPAPSGESTSHTPPH
jgi:type IV secretion system protein VirB1